MPRQVFDSFEELEKWCKEFVKEGKYTIYTTDNNELILEPIRSTKPRRFAYLWSPAAQKFAETLVKKYNIKHFHLERYEWDTEKAPEITTKPQ